jgi:uncharacterized membrane protein
MNDLPPERPEAPVPPPPQGGYYAQPVFVPPGAQPPPGYLPYNPAGAPAPRPTNGYAVASMVVSGTSLGFLIFTAGLLSPITLIASIIGTVLGHKGKTDVDQGKATQQRDLAVAGFWMGVSGIVLSVLAVIAWIAVIVIAVAADDTHSTYEFHRQFNWQ